MLNISSSPYRLGPAPKVGSPSLQNFRTARQMFGTIPVLTLHQASRFLICPFLHDSYVLDRKHETGIHLNRITTIPMPHRGKQAVLRTKTTDAPAIVAAIPKTAFAKMSAIDLLKWGLQYNRNVAKAWLRDLLVKEKLIEDTNQGKVTRFWADYQAQCLFIKGMQAALGDDYEPRLPKQSRTEDGGFGPSKNGVPQNYLTVKYLLHAYDLSYTSFKRMKASDNFVAAERVHKNKGKSVFADKGFAAKFYTPYRMYLKLKWAQWMETDEGRNADYGRKNVSKILFCLSYHVITLTPCRFSARERKLLSRLCHLQSWTHMRRCQGIS